MKRNIQIITSASAASLMAFTTLAQETPVAKTGRTEITQERSIQSMRAVRLGRTEKASDVIGTEVQNYNGEKLGKVDDFAVDLETGRIVEVVLSTGGVLGLGVMMVPVPPGALHHDVTTKVIHLKSDMQKLKSAPRYGMSKWAELGESNKVAEVYRYHGQEPYFTAAYQPALGPDPTARLGYIQRVTKLMGAAVKNVQSETLGKVEDIILDLSAGRVVSVVVSSGGFLGLGDELSAVPSAAFQFNSENEFLQLDTTKEALSSAPHFKSSEWPDFGQPGYAAGVYRAYKVDPYFTTSVVVAADNTARNVRDRNNPLTPLDQGNSQADVDTTAQIRKGILAGKDMSVNAQNVKIITSKGQVTLRGPVDTAEEKRLIGEIAISIALVENVNNQLEVK
jgi:hyperosmotically inducible protein